MEKIKLSDRLSRLAELVQEGARLADIGSDHAFLPTYLVQSGKIDFAVAGEVVEGPYSIAKQHVKEQELEENITVRLANGLAAIEKEDEIDTVVIAGMGGLLISEILSADKEKLNAIEHLILQPNNHEDSLREWLNQHDFDIVKEDILLEAGKFYEIILAQKAQRHSISYNEQELRFGPILLKEKSAIFLKKWEKELATREKISSHLPEDQTERKSELEAEIKEIREILE